MTAVMEPESVRERGRLGGVSMMLGSALSNQVGAATGALAFPAIGPAGVVAVRQWVAAILLVGITRPRFRAFTRREWFPVLALAVVYATMNLTLYTAIDRIGLGLAVTLEFLGPLAIALSASRRRLDLYCALAAGAAVIVLMRPQPTTDYFGIALGLVAAACWAAYILLNRTLGSRLPSAQGAAAASTVSAIVYLPLGLWILIDHRPSLEYVGYAVAAGALVGRSVPGRSRRLAPRPGRLLRLVHERQPAARSTGRLGGSRSDARPDRVARHRRDRRGQRHRRRHSRRARHPRRALNARR